MSENATRSVIHETLSFERSLLASPARVFAAYADPQLRARWSAPSPSAAVVYSSTDFSVGGSDCFLCGNRSSLEYRGQVQYLAITEGQRIVYSEVISKGEVQLSASLVSWDIISNGEGSLLFVTDHVASFVGTEMIAGNREGMTAALNNLVAAVDVSAR